jgi:hypothetical protein
MVCLAHHFIYLITIQAAFSDFFLSGAGNISFLAPFSPIDAIFIVFTQRRPPPKGKSSGKHQFQWWDVPWVHFSETTSENRDRRL